MTREMQKAERALPLKRVTELIEKGDQGVLCVNGDDGYPYAIPTHYIYMNDAIYIHSAKTGYKVEALGKDKKVCFTSVLFSEPIPELFTTRFESIVVTGNAEFIENESERQKVMEAFVRRFSPDYVDGGMKFIRAALGKTLIIKISIEEIKGKAHRMPTSNNG